MLLFPKLTNRQADCFFRSRTFVQDQTCRVNAGSDGYNKMRLQLLTRLERFHPGEKINVMNLLVKS